MTNDDNVIDAEVVEVTETPNLPAVVEAQPWSDEVMEDDSVSRSNGVTYEAKPGRTAAGLSLDPAAVARHDAALAANAERRCVATTPKGQCRKFAIMGSTVCKTHGGATAHIKSKARIRVENVSFKAVGKLVEVAFDDTKPAAVQLAAIRDLLDRGGLKPPSEVVLSQGEPKAYETVFDSIGGTPGDQSPSVATGYGPAGVESHISPAPAYTHESMAAGGGAEAGRCDPPAREDRHGSGAEAPPRRPRPRDRGRDRRDQPPSRHITGEAAMRAANRINQMNQDMPPPLAITSPHKGYRRP